MTYNLININYFKDIINCNLEDGLLERRSQFKISKLKEKISNSIKNVIHYLDNGICDIDYKPISDFLLKIATIDDYFYKSGHKNVFSELISRLNLFRIKQDSFVSELSKWSEATDIPEKDRTTIAKKLYRFQENMLFSAIQLANTPEEMNALKDTVSLSLSLSPKLSSADSHGALEKSRAKIETIWSVKWAEIEVKVESLVKSIQIRISNLSFESTQSRLNEEVRNIQSDIQQLKKLSFQHQDLTPLENMLGLIKDPSLLKVSHEEGRFIELLLIDHFGLSTEEVEKSHEFKKTFYSYFDLQKLSIHDAQLLILEALQKNTNSIDKLLEAAKQVQNGLQDKTIQYRLNQFLCKNPNLDKPNLPAHYLKIINVFQAFTINSKKELYDRWAQIFKPYDVETNGRFSELLKHYSYANPIQSFDIYIKDAQEVFFKSFQDMLLKFLHLQNPFSDFNVNTLLERVTYRLESWALEQFEQEYQEMFIKRHLWLVKNYSNIVIPYNQADDKNVSHGVCYANSLNRFSLLIENPLVSILIPAGSNERTRFYQRRYCAQYDLIDDNNVRTNELAGKFGLKKASEYQVRVKKDAKTRYRDLVNRMERGAKAGITQFILLLIKQRNDQDSKPEDHAININLDINNETFQIIDDNIGVVRYSSIDEFRKKTKSYLKAWYSDFTQYIIQVFERSTSLLSATPLSLLE